MAIDRSVFGKHLKEGGGETRERRNENKCTICNQQGGIRLPAPEGLKQPSAPVLAKKPRSTVPTPPSCLQSSANIFKMFGVVKLQDSVHLRLNSWSGSSCCSSQEDWEMREVVWKLLVPEEGVQGGQSFPCTRWPLAVQSQACRDGGGRQRASLLPKAGA